MSPMFRRYSHTIVFLSFTFALINCSKAQFYYGSRQEFGKYRIQRQPFAWTYFPFERFQVYLFEGGQDVARYVAISMQKHLEAMERSLDYHCEEKIKVLVYNNYEDFAQSNLGLASEEQTNLGGTTRIAGSKMSVYFDGNHTELDRQIRAGLAELLINQLLYGGKARDMLKNSTLLTLPGWFQKGLIAYLSEKWNTDVDSHVLDAVEHDQFLHFNRLEGEEATLAGHALWNYIAETYGEAVIPNLLYMTKVSRNVDNAFIFVLATSVNQLISEWMSSYVKNDSYNDSTRTLPSGDEILKKPKRGTHYLRPQLNPNANLLAYVSSEQNQNKVWLMDLASGKKKKIFRSGPKLDRLQDFSYPLIAWHPSGIYCGIISELKNQLVLITYDVEEKKRLYRNITGFEKISDFSYSPDGKKLIFSGVEKGKGQSDVFVFTIATAGIEKITNDIYDDFFPRFISNGQQIAFASNRLSDTLKNQDNGKYNYEQPTQTDIFLLDYPVRKSILYRVTNTMDVQETQPVDFGQGNFGYLSNANGINNIVSGKLDSVLAYVDTTEHYRFEFHPKVITNYKRNAEWIFVNSKHDYLTETFFIDGRFKIFNRKLSSEDTSRKIISHTYFRYQLEKNELFRKSLFKDERKETDSSITHQKNQTNDKANGISKNLNYTPKNFPSSIQQNYYVSFSMDYVVSQLDNSFLNAQYQPFSGGTNPVYLNPGLNALLKAGLSDLFEDYRIVGAVRFSNNLENEYILSWENRKKLIDKQIIGHRQVFLNYGSGLQKVQVHDIQYKLKIPFTEVFGLRIAALARNDTRKFLAIDDANLKKKDERSYLTGVKAELILDNSIAKGLNLFHGFRGKIFSEYYRFITKNRNDLITFGFDFRHYQKLHREIIWANRLAGSGSLGTNRLIFYLGGIDSWFRPRFDNTINILHPEQYAFQTIATNLRGFRQNIRNGNNFIVFNSEIRIPLFRYLISHPLKSDFFHHFQLVVFGDAGSAWYGWNPYSAENTLNVNTYGAPGNPVNVTLFQQKEPIVGGMGFGVRSRIFGYFVRLDFAWGIDDHSIKKAMPMLSFCTDF
jgi:hypothetical protein